MINFDIFIDHLKQLFGENCKIVHPTNITNGCKWIAVRGTFDTLPFLQESYPDFKNLPQLAKIIHENMLIQSKVLLGYSNIELYIEVSESHYPNLAAIELTLKIVPLKRNNPKLMTQEYQGTLISTRKCLRQIILDYTNKVLPEGQVEAVAFTYGNYDQNINDPAEFSVHYWDKII